MAWCRLYDDANIFDEIGLCGVFMAEKCKCLIDGLPVAMATFCLRGACYETSLDDHILHKTHHHDCADSFPWSCYKLFLCII